MIACSDIIAYLNDNYNYVKSLSELSNNEKIECAENAFNTFSWLYSLISSASAKFF